MHDFHHICFCDFGECGMPSVLHTKHFAAEALQHACQELALYHTKVELNEPAPRLVHLDFSQVQHHHVGHGPQKVLPG